MRYTGLVLILIFLILCLSVTCGRGKDDAPHAVIFILIDTLRADGLGCYGAGEKASPRIDALARDGALFRRAISPSSRTLPSIMSIMTSLPPSLHGRIYPMEDKLKALSPDITTLAEALRQRGYRTAAFTEGGYISSFFGFDRGFDFYREPGTSGEQKGGVKETYRHAEAWLRKNSGNRFFLLLHTYQTHLPYEPHEDTFQADTSLPFPQGFGFDHKGKFEADPSSLSEKELEAVRELYRGEIQYVDRYIGKLVTLLKELDILDRSLIVFTSDHGDEFFERLHFGHSRTLFEELVHVPLIFHYPEMIPSGIIVDQQVSLLDIFPTIMELCSGKIEGNIFFGRSLMPFLSEAASKVFAAPAYSEVYRYNYLASIRFKEYKYILHLRTGKGELYNLVSDPGERNSLVEKEAATAREMHQKLTEYLQNAAAVRKTLRQGGAVGAPEEELREELKALGYLQ